MVNNIEELLPDTLSGPRSYFTDIDPNVPESGNIDAIRKLKLQLLTKEKIVVAASSLFHDIWYEIIKHDQGLIDSLRYGIIIPAIRSVFKGVNGFFIEKEYPSSNKDFFIENVAYSVPWKLEDNANWFRTQYMEGLNNTESVLRRVASFSDDEAALIRDKLVSLIECETEGQQFLQRKHIKQAAKLVSHDKETLLIDYSNLIYRISGSIVVKSEGHFPQSNLIKIAIVGNEGVLKDENIFWDIYAEAVFTLLGTAIRLTPGRLDSLTFSDILKIRKTFFDIGFTGDYDDLLKSVKESVNINDPEKLILHAHEIATTAVKLRDSFSEKVKNELSKNDSKMREESLWQIASGISIVSNPIVGAAVGIVSTLKSLPEITAPFSKSLSNALEERYQWIKDFINTRVGWSNNQKKSFIEAYKILVQYGLTP
ncbi:hypothetical protein MNBD_IGNAVI01-1339 [hydrothermal vent metagenome]|uniref:Uncharacterized protein n=1 Tax=hydrothermal vent metagenome TaxID=652676 RepID=A0A3B1CJH4_9ZZZZ